MVCCEVQEDFEVAEYFKCINEYQTNVFKKIFKKGHKFYFKKSKDALDFIRKYPTKIQPGFHLEVTKDFICYSKYSNFKKEYKEGQLIHFFTPEAANKFQQIFHESTRY